MSKWHFKKDGDIKGPFSDEQLKALCEAGAVDASTPVWQPSFSEWKALAETDFFHRDAIDPPPLPPKQDAGVAHQTQAATSSTAPMPGDGSVIYDAPLELRPIATLKTIITVAAIPIMLIPVFTSLVLASVANRKGSGSLQIALDYVSGANTGGLPNLEIMDGIAAIFGLAALIAGCMWIYRATANLFHFGLERLQITPGWAVGWFFIPVAFLWKPFQAMSQLERASRYDSSWWIRPSSSLLKWWWGMFLASFFIDMAVLGAAQQATTVTGAKGVVGWQLISAIVDTVFILLFVLVVHRITGMQERLARTAPGRMTEL